jgi:hypothetical protein
VSSLALWAKGNLPQFSILSPLHPKRAYAFSLSDACFYDFFFWDEVGAPAAAPRVQVLIGGLPRDHTEEDLHERREPLTQVSHFL